MTYEKDCIASTQEAFMYLSGDWLTRLTWRGGPDFLTSVYFGDVRGLVRQIALTSRQHSGLAPRRSIPFGESTPKTTDIGVGYHACDKDVGPVSYLGDYFGVIDRLQMLAKSACRTVYVTFTTPIGGPEGSDTAC